MWTPFHGLLVSLIYPCIPSLNDISFGSGRGLMHAVVMHDRAQMLVWLLMRGAG